MDKKTLEYASEWVMRAQEGLSESEQKELQEWLKNTNGAQVAFEEAKTAWDNFGVIADTDLVDDLVEPDSNQIRWYYAVAAAIFLLISGLTWQASQTEAEDPWGVANRMVAVSEDTDYLELEDGSTIELNTDTKVEYSLTEKAREVWLLGGEAFFSVEKDNSRPFKVYAGPSITEVTGTAFNVNFQADSVEVFVTEGNVIFALNEGNQTNSGVDLPSAELAEFERALLLVNNETENGLVIDKLSIDEGNKVISWKPVTLRFDSTPVSEVIKQFNKYNHTKIVVIDEKINELELAVNFRSNKLEAFIRMLEISSNVIAHKVENEIHLYLDKED